MLFHDMIDAVHCVSQGASVTALPYRQEFQINAVQKMVNEEGVVSFCLSM